MDPSNITLDNILFNYYSFGSLLVVVLTFLLGFFFLTLKGKTAATYQLGIGMVLMCLFQMGYFLAAFIYHPISAYHRWITVGIILPLILHLGQFLLRWPSNENKKLADIMLIVNWIIAIVATVYFVYSTTSSDKIYHFTAHHWDFDAVNPSKYLSFIISFSIVVNFIILPIWRAFHLQGRKRWTLVAYMTSLLIGSGIPNTLNVLSRDGSIERSTYLTALVLLLYFAFFLITVIFINSSTERTTFMIKIVGISLVTVMLIFEQLALIYDQEKEDQYNKISIATIKKALAEDSIPDSISFVISYPKDSSGLVYKKYNPEIRLDLPMVKTDMENSRIFEDISNLNAKGFRSRLKYLLESTGAEFEGYKLSTLQFLDDNQSLSDEDLKSAIFEFFNKINKTTFVASSKLGDMPADENFCKNAVAFIEKTQGLDSFEVAINKKLQDCKWEGAELETAELRSQILKYFRYFKSAETRHYRKSLSSIEHYVAFMIYNPKDKSMVEVGLPYVEYRKVMNRSAQKEMMLMFVALLVLLVAFPLFFKISLVTPLNELLSGVEKVNDGDLDVKVPIHVNDEVGFLADSFNKMVSSIKEARRQLEDYAENLEQKVQERTKEVQEKMEEVQKLKVQQDGDYFLTSLLAKPLYFNANKSKFIQTDFFVKQKKTFEFRKKTGDLGGDISVTGNLKLGGSENFRRYTVAINGDAMGKSMQGAGGSLVMGVVMNSIMARSAGNKRILNRTPEEWLADVYEETNSVFKSFNGTMVISATIFMVDDETGEVWYFNAEHPFTVLYRDGKASFIEKELLLRKLGLDSEIPFEVRKFQLLPGDTIIMGTDGRDDIDLTPDQDFRTMNEDEEIFLKHVEEAQADIYKIEEILRSKGDLTDDLSLLRLNFQHDGHSKQDSNDGIAALESEHSELDGSSGDSFSPDESEEWERKYTTEGAYDEGRKLYKQGEIESAIEVMYKAYSADNTDPKLNKLLSLLTFKGRDYDKAVDVLDVYLKQDPDAGEFWYYLSVAQKKLGDYQRALDAGMKSYSFQQDFLSNLINIADLNRLLGNMDESRDFAKKAESIEPDNKNVKKLFQLIEKNV
ncbi:SpoIIE family protein phosphatase [Leptospira sp. GIMC2001]|uniref:SpoIIE family protein phosphatase n=1 Tax=Leptospira sp. GIMC2001 TaxID=1513297 RepID=UPI00234B3A04|nr:SpoIIE family protein phosphatase [Leptospira sp. GIMC2001]WCL48984.1 SpoIIE family protein phosphatase [Leptospira sp. GIMC2001]